VTSHKQVHDEVRLILNGPLRLEKSQRQAKFDFEYRTMIRGRSTMVQDEANNGLIIETNYPEIVINGKKVKW